MKFITYHLDNNSQGCSLKIPHSNLSFNDLAKKEALQKLENHNYTYASIAGANLGESKSEDPQFRVYVPLNQQGLRLVQQGYYFVFTSVVVIFIASFIYGKLSLPLEDSAYNFSIFYEFYQSLFNYGFTIFNYNPVVHNTVSMAYLFMSPVFTIIEISITMVLYLLVKPQLSFLPSRVLRLIFHEMFPV
ncbi:MAG: hypothetical protein KC646_04105 [Candidatus Cloacimonetes bacterium]|nr:hypothetical protein [Candidatus Cloacimonadota bacterium]